MFLLSLTQYFGKGNILMRPFGNSKLLEKRRKDAVGLVIEEDKGTTEVARKFKVNVRSVQRWVERYRKHGQMGIQSRPTPGRPARLDIKQKRRLEKILLRGAQKSGFSTDLWTCPRIQKIIKDHFGVTYHVDHIVRLLGSLGWSAQMPQRRAMERDEKKIKQWKRYRWVQIKKKPKEKEQRLRS